MSELTKNDYQNILIFYKKKIPRSNRLLKLRAENILSNKLCRCIKKLDPQNESKSIGICTKTIFNKKGYTRGKFKCKGKNTIKLKKYKNNSTIKNKN